MARVRKSFTNSWAGQVDAFRTPKKETVAPLPSTAINLWASRVAIKTSDAHGAETMLDHALHWAGRGLYIFPCSRFLGRPLVNSFYKDATTDEKVIVDWWSLWPTADIGCVPSRSGHYVIACFEDEGGSDSLGELEDELGSLPREFVTEDAWNNLYFWMRGSAYTSHHRLGRGVHVLGTGQKVFLPQSWAPHICYSRELEAA